MGTADVIPLLLLALAAMVGGGVAYRSSRGRRRRNGFARWKHGMGDTLANGDASGFPPTRVMSYAEAVREGWFAATIGRPVAEAPAAGRLPGVLPDDATLPQQLRVKLQMRDAASRFVTLHVLRLVVEDGERTVHARVGDDPTVERIPVNRIEAAIDLHGRSRIDDPWGWLRTRLGAASRIERNAAGLASGNTLVSRAGIVRRDPGSAIDTATQPA